MYKCARGWMERPGLADLTICLTRGLIDWCILYSCRSILSVRGLYRYALTSQGLTNGASAAPSCDSYSEVIRLLSVGRSTGASYPKTVIGIGWNKVQMEVYSILWYHQIMTLNDIWYANLDTLPLFPAAPLRSPPKPWREQLQSCWKLA
jgi:hypothetical protein